MNDAQIQETIEMLLAEREGKSICPSEVARALADDWRPLMPAVRRVAERLAHQRRLRITQGGEAVDPDDYSGPIRLAPTA